MQDMLASLNALSTFTAKYLGTAVIVNYWKSSRPEDEWLRGFDIDRSAILSSSKSMAVDLSQPISPEELGLLQRWVAQFIERCSRVLRDFPELMAQGDLTDRQKSILLSSPDKAT